MAEPFLGEIRAVGFNFAPVGWATCDGQVLLINQNSALFALLGTTYGGDGVQTFALPDLRGRVAVHQGTGPGLPASVIGGNTGSPTVTLSTSNLPPHTHPLNCVGAGGNQATPVDACPAIESTGTSLDYSTSAPTGQMSPAAMGTTGNGVPVSIQPPSLCVNFIIALQGIFPARN